MFSPSIPLQLAGVSHSYAGRVALQGLDLQLQAGEITALLGPNGAGKSTALGLMYGLLQPEQGQVRLWGLAPRTLAVRRRLGVMLQQAALPDNLRVAELVALAASYYPQPLALAQLRHDCGLDAIWSRRYQALSGGQQRMVQFAQAVVGRPDLLLLDEPSVGLDHHARQQLWASVRALAGAGCAVLLATHHLEEAEALASQVLMLRQGRPVASGALATLRRQQPAVQIRCRSRLSAAQLADWPQVQGVLSRDGWLQLQVEQAEPVLVALLAADPGLSELEVRRTSLSEMFSHLCGTEAVSLPSLGEAA